MHLRCEAVDVNARPRTAGLACTGCGCTDDAACPGGCWWVTYNPPLCSACAAKAKLLIGDGDTGFFSQELCPAFGAPTLHAPIFVEADSGHCVNCQMGFVL